MLMLKPLPIDRSAADANMVLSNHFHCARRFHHPRTRTYVRLLGPCFKTGRREPYCLHTQLELSMWSVKNKVATFYTRPNTNSSNPSIRLLRVVSASPGGVRKYVRWILQGTFAHPEASYHVPRVVSTNTPNLTHKARNIAHNKIKTHITIFISNASNHSSMQQPSQAALVPSAFLSASSGTFNSLSKVLFIFPSWYLFAIGFESIFSLRWNLPPSLRSNPEERDS